MKKKFWYIVHNVIAHPLLVIGFGWTKWLHDWTGDKFLSGDEYDEVMRIHEEAAKRWREERIEYIKDMLDNVYHHRIDAETAYKYIVKKFNGDL